MAGAVAWTRRQRPKVSPSEHQLQAACVEYAAWAFKPNVRMVKITNEQASAAARIKGAKEGVWKGAPDCLVIEGRRPWAKVTGVEFKAARGRATLEQQEFLQWGEDNGLTAILIRSVEEFAELAAACGWIKPGVALGGGRSHAPGAVQP